MKLTKCDNHHDRDAVLTITIRKLPTGSRPMLIGYYDTPRTYHDLCQECAERIGMTTG